MKTPDLPPDRLGASDAALFCGLALGTVAYVASHSFGWPVLVYLPVRGTWTWHEPAGAISMHYYGVVLWGLVFGAIGAALGRWSAVARRLPSRLTVTLTMALFVDGLAFDSGGLRDFLENARPIVAQPRVRPLARAAGEQIVVAVTVEIRRQQRFGPRIAGQATQPCRVGEGTLFGQAKKPQRPGPVVADRVEQAVAIRVQHRHGAAQVQRRLRREIAKFRNEFQVAGGTHRPRRFGRRRWRRGLRLRQRGEDFAHRRAGKAGHQRRVRPLGPDRGFVQRRQKGGGGLRSEAAASPAMPRQPRRQSHRHGDHGQPQKNRSD